VNCGEYLTQTHSVIFLFYRLFSVPVGKRYDPSLPEFKLRSSDFRYQ